MLIKLVIIISFFAFSRYNEKEKKEAKSRRKKNTIIGDTMYRYHLKSDRIFIIQLILYILDM